MSALHFFSVSVKKHLERIHVNVSLGVLRTQDALELAFDFLAVRNSCLFLVIRCFKRIIYGAGGIRITNYPVRYGKFK